MHKLRQLKSLKTQAKEIPLLTPKQKKRRIEWAKQLKNWTLSQWRSVIWSDESRFEVCVGDERGRVIKNAKEAFHNSQGLP